MSSEIKVMAAPAGPVLRGQRFANEQILRGPALAARKGPVQACLQGWSKIGHRFEETKQITMFPSCYAIWKQRSSCHDGERFLRDWAVLL